jgi:hypothetical protein
MRDSASCADVHELTAELALGIADGEERARALEHIAGCFECQRELERLSALADELLELAPEHEPPVGFELRALQSFEPRVRRRRVVRPALALAATVVVAVALTAGATLFAARDDLRLAHHYRSTLTAAHGSYFGAVPLTDSGGRTGGVLFIYRGAPSWLMVTVDGAYRFSAKRVEIVGTTGRVIPLPWPRLTIGSWGGALPVELGAVTSVRLVDGGGRVLLAATMQQPR